MPSALTPGRALDLGAGEGGDALWLAGQGWRVTATDVSQTACDRIFLLQNLAWEFACKREMLLQ